MILVLYKAMVRMNLLVLAAVPGQADEVPEVSDGFPGYSSLLLISRTLRINLLVRPAVVKLPLRLILNDGDADPGPALLCKFYLVQKSLLLLSSSGVMSAVTSSVLFSSFSTFFS